MNPFDTLRAHRVAMSGQRIEDLFKKDTARFSAFSARLDDMVFDYSKTAIDQVALDQLLGLATQRDVEGQRDAMFRGARINTTEDRAVLHTALRNRSDRPVVVDGYDIMPGVRETLAAMSDFARAVRDGIHQSARGDRFTDVVNIGIGGSDLGPVMAAHALVPWHDGPRVHFVSNVDGAHISDVLSKLKPKETMVIIASKTFTTIETMTNAKTARDWLVQGCGPDISAHLVALSTAQDKTAEFGVHPSRVFGFEDWVGGRYSVWGPIGLSVMLAVGPEVFGEVLDGGFQMDEHFRTAPLERNLPMLLGLVGIWHNNICGYPTRAVLPYDQRLLRLPAYLQQLDMESNGKRVAKDGAALAEPSGPVVWGEPGTNGQHAFYQLIHQGTEVIPCEFLVAATGNEPDLAHQHDLLVANCLAQSEALMLGRLEADTPHRVFPGNRPSTTLMYRRLTPETLGRIIALYEHRVFVEGAIWGINSFDQWGVELGKVLAQQMLPLVQGSGDPDSKDGSTSGLLNSLAELRS
ncbi:MAG: glucose-6-phosphate isomerase [Pseudomonadota bacterium]